MGNQQRSESGVLFGAPGLDGTGAEARLEESAMLGKNRLGRAAGVGLCFPQAWMFVVSKGLVFEGLDFQFAFHVGMCLCLVCVAAFVAMTKGRLVSLRRVMMVASALGMALLPMVGLLLPTPPASVGMAVVLISGASVGFSFSLWFDAYSKLPVEKAFSFILLGFSGGALGCLLLSAALAVSSHAVLAIACVLPFLSCAALRRSAGWVDVHTEWTEGGLGAPGDDKPRSSLRHVVFLLVQIVIYAVVFGNGIIFSVVQSDSIDGAYKVFIVPLNYGLRFLFPLLMLAWFRIQHQAERRVLRSAANAVLLAIVFVLLGFWFLGGANTVIAYSLVSVARNLVLILIYLALIQLVHATSRQPLLIFGVGRGLYEASVAFGVAVYAHFRTQVGALAIEEDAVYLTAFCVFAFLASCLLATLQSLGDFQGTDAPGDGADVPQGGDGCEAGASSVRIDERASDETLRVLLAETYQLSEREIEVALLFSQGNSKKRIADMVMLSENTVRWYLQQIYVKLNVHSRDELIELAESLLRR